MVDFFGNDLWSMPGPLRIFWLREIQMEHKCVNHAWIGQVHKGVLRWLVRTAMVTAYRPHNSSILGHSSMTIRLAARRKRQNNLDLQRDG